MSSFAFTVVLDAGHGGQDAGAVGAFSKEKNINLTYVLALGEKITANHKDVKVIYTRTTDVFIPLNERAQIANKANVDLFISIHTNAAKSRSANGTETFTLGHARSKENMELAMLENSVILLEEDYKNTYEGFDPNSTDSYIMFQFMQDQYREHSIKLADLIQQNLTKNTTLTDRGVRQAGFLLLRATTMPSILVELGFISNREEEKYLNRKENQNKIIDALYDSFTHYKKQLEIKNGGQAFERSQNTTIHTTTTQPTTTPQPQATSTATATPLGDIVFKVQFLVSKTKYKSGNAIFKGVRDVDNMYENGYYKYTTGATSSVDAANNLKAEVARKFPDAFLIAYKKGKKINIHTAIKEATEINK
ncbi:MAG: N-acetylmuramoyl-L-alanine amidase [Paludibacteraceae bacterium]|nr:N-acetylmuramoyl-L-alanine amidase [Paludibacteraceae bacterium]MBP6284764.1 N-acetylmuramoyl-L-alanine amidase [Paludibacteraceae bacterium]